MIDNWAYKSLHLKSSIEERFQILGAGLQPQNMFLLHSFSMAQTCMQQL